MPATWFALLKTELDALTEDDLIDPQGEIDENDHIAGSIASDSELQKIYVLGRKLREAAERMALDARYAKNRRTMEELIARASELSNKSSIVMEIFWASLHDSFNLWDKTSIGIREGWQVVWTDQDTSLPPFIRKLFGDM